jgi:hypothetical protein
MSPHTNWLFAALLMVLAFFTEGTLLAQNTITTGGLLSRGFDLASCPTKPLSSFHAYRHFT